MLIYAKDAKSQTNGVPDTLTYLQTIIANKSQYIGQPFSVLMDSLKIQIKFFSPVANIHYDKSKETATRFSFFYPQTANDMYLTYPVLRISWQPYLNAAQSSILYTQFDGGGWATPVVNFYANGIIKDIQIRE